jgi:hypothetical protein
MAKASYDYIRRMYGVDPQVGRRVRHTVTNRFGYVGKARSPEHYVHVTFDGSKYSAPCHPTELDYAPCEDHS